MTLSRRLVLALALAAGPARAQDPAPQGTAPEERLPVVASFSVLADMVRVVGGARVEVSSLIGPDTDAHGFEPTPADAVRLSRARLVVANGLGFEGWLPRLQAASGTRAPTVVASRGVKPLAEPGGHGHAHGHGPDPHAFQSAANARLYALTIRDGLTAADPAGREFFAANAERYAQELDALDREVRQELGRLPPSRRRVVTDHDAFAYFAAAYGLTILAPRGLSKEADVSARDVARIVRQIRAEKVPAVFLENVSDARLLEQIARESGARIGGRLFSDALSGPDGPAPTYLRLMRHNARTLAEALAP